MLDIRRRGVGIVWWTAITGLLMAVTACSGMPALLGDSQAGGDVSGGARSYELGTTTETPDATTPGEVDAAGPGQLDFDEGGYRYLEVEVGQCLTYTSVPDDRADRDYKVTDVREMPCGAIGSSYRVIAKTPTTEECPADGNGSWYETATDSSDWQTGAVCLDYDWVEGECTSLPPSRDAVVARDQHGTPVDEHGNWIQPMRVACDDRAVTNVWRVGRIVWDAASVQVCSQGESGFVYEVRRFVVCATQL